MIIKESHLFFSSTTEVDAIIQPLKDFFGVTSFVYHCSYQDGTEIKLSNQPEWTRYYYEQELYRYSVFEHDPSEYRADIKLWAALPQHAPILNAARKFNIDHGITLIYPVENAVEFVFFGTSSDRSFVSNKLISNVDLLQRFILYFKEQAKGLLKQAQKTRVKIPNKFELIQDTAPKFLYDDNFRENFLSEIPIKKMFINSEVNLTKREVACVKLILSGATLKEVALKLDLSPRTVESHCNNIKLKLGCANLTELRQYLLKSSWTKSLL